MDEKTLIQQYKTVNNLLQAMVEAEHADIQALQVGYKKDAFDKLYEGLTVILTEIRAELDHSYNIRLP